MKPKKIKINIFITSFILLVTIISQTDLSKYTHYYNTDHSYKDTLNVQISFADDNLNEKELYLYYSDSVNTNSAFSDNRKTVTVVKNKTAYFSFYTHDIPKLFRINFDKDLKETVVIENFILKLPEKEIKTDLTGFLSHPSVKIIKKEPERLIIDLLPVDHINYDPYIYLEKPLYIHKLNIISYFIIVIILLILSFLIAELSVFLINFRATNETINTVLLFLLIVSLLFKEHWISKITILIAFYTIFLLFKKKTKLKNISYYGFLLFFMFAVISLIWSVNSERSLPKLIGLLPLVIIPVWANFLNMKIRYDKIFKYIGVVYALVSFLTLLLAYFRFKTTHQLSEFYYHTLASPLSTNAIYISILYLMVYLFNLYGFINKNDKVQIKDYFILMVLFTYILFLSSKLIIFLLFAGTIIIVYPLWILKPENRKKVIKGILFLSILISMFIFFNKNISERYKKISSIEKVKEVFSKSEFGNNYLWNGLNLRLFQLRAFYDIEKNKDFNSILGVGLNNGQLLLNERYKAYKLYTGKEWETNGGYLKYNFHNQYAQTLIELGFIGFLLLLYIFYSLFINAKNNKNHLLFTVVLIFVMLMFTESLLVRQKGIMFFALFPIIAIKMKQLLKQKDYFSFSNVE